MTNQVTITRESKTLVVRGSVTGFDVCPLCGQNLVPGESDHLTPRLKEGSTGGDCG
jgi:hypothetical protein